MSELVRLEVEAGVGTLRIDRPKLNALNIEIQDALADLAAEAAARRDIRAVIVYGGERAFAAGADIKEMAAMSYTDMVERSRELQRCFAAVARIPKPTVAAVTGYALGGGCELALCCDFRIAGSNAVFGQPEVLLGVMPGAGGTQRLPRLIGSARAKDLLFSGRQVTAAEALAIGLVDEVVEPEAVYSTAVERMRKYVTLPPYALRAIKQSVDAGLDVDLATGLDIEATQFAGTFATRDREIGMSSFMTDGPGKASFEGR
jgi:enoyl-CoA hydratase